MKAIRLKTEYLTNPMGIDTVAPRLFWNCEGGITQTAWQIMAQVNGQTVWDSQQTASSSMHAVYSGRALQSRDTVIWKARLWDERDEAGEWSEEASFEIGLLRAEDWQAQWLSLIHI